MKSRLICLLLILFFVLSYATFTHAEVLTLPQGLRLAIENSRLIKITASDESISESDIIIARAKMLPDINASFQQTYLAHQPGAIFGTQSVPTAENSSFSYGVNVQQTLFDFGRNALHYKASKTNVEIKKLDTKRIKNLVAIEFALIYFDLLESEKIVAVAEKEAERLESHLNDARNLFENGVITKNDLLQAEVKLSDAKQKLLTGKNLRAMNASRLNNSLSMSLRTNVEVMDVTDFPSNGLDMDIDKMWEAAEQQRTELQIVDTTIKSFGFEEKSKKAEYFPRFFVQGGYNFYENRYQLYEGNWALTLGMNFNLFNGGSTNAEIAKIGNQKQKLLQQRSKLIDEIRLEVQKCMLDLKAARERVNVTKDAVQQAEENLRINKLRYEEGIGTATEVLDAVTLLTVAETNYYKSLYDFRKSEAGLMYSMGKDLWEVYK